MDDDLTVTQDDRPARRRGVPVTMTPDKWVAALVFAAILFLCGMGFGFRSVLR